MLSVPEGKGGVWEDIESGRKSQLPGYIQCMACNPHQILPFTGDKVILQIEVESFIIHGVNGFPEQPGTSIRCHIVPVSYTHLDVYKRQD